MTYFSKCLNCQKTQKLTNSQICSIREQGLPKNALINRYKVPYICNDCELEIDSDYDYDCLIRSADRLYTIPNATKKDATLVYLNLSLDYDLVKNDEECQRLSKCEDWFSLIDRFESIDIEQKNIDIKKEYENIENGL